MQVFLYVLSMMIGGIAFYPAFWAYEAHIIPWYWFLIMPLCLATSEIISEVRRKL